MAEEYGVADNQLFVETLQIYERQLKQLGILAKAIEEQGALVKKEYVKGSGNLYANPAISEYSKTADSANRTAATLLKIIRQLGQTEAVDVDPLQDLINGDEQSV